MKKITYQSVQTIMNELFESVKRAWHKRTKNS